MSTWVVGTNQPIPHGTGHDNSFIRFDPKTMKKPVLYGLMISSVIPRPIALISSQDSEGHVNCAPFSYFNVMCHDPPILAVGLNLNSSRTSDNTKKDTLNNIEGTKQFVVNIMSDWFVDSANHTSGKFPPHVDEMSVAGLTQLASEVVKPPRVGESAIQMECELCDIKPILNDGGKHTCSIVYGRIVRMHVHDSVLAKDSHGSINIDAPVVDYRSLKPVARMGGDTYTVVRDGFDLSRPKV